MAAAEPTAGTVAVRQKRDGTMLYRVALAPDHLPPVRPRDLADAWDFARAAALDEEWGPARLFRFTPPVPNAPTLDLALIDADACCWTQAVARSRGLDDVGGISVCLRLLGLIHLLAEADWVRALFAVGRDGARLSPALLQAAASLPLTAAARLDEAAVRSACDAALSLRGRTGYIPLTISGVSA